MDKLFVLITQLQNGTGKLISFRPANQNGYHPRLPVLRPGETRLVKQSRILKWIKQHEHPEHLKIRVLLNNHLMGGVELDPWHLLSHTRILFKFGLHGVLTVLGVKEKPTSLADFFLRLKYFGFMRNIFWDERRRCTALIAQSDMELAFRMRTKQENRPMDHGRGEQDEFFRDSPAKARPIEQENRLMDHVGGDQDESLLVSSVKAPRTKKDRPIDHVKGDQDEFLPLSPVKAPRTKQENDRPMDHRGGVHYEPYQITSVKARKTEQEKASDLRGGDHNDAFVHCFLFCVALLLVWYLHMPFAT